jgi:ABC-type glutathione transport system ATPase component
MKNDQRMPTDRIVSVKRLCKRYLRGSVWRKRVPVNAVNDVEFEITAGRTLALIGRSGSGKSTIARCVTRIEKPDSGQVWIDGTDIASLSSRDLSPFRSRLQMVFQDAELSMNPRFSAREVIEEPLLIQARHAEERRDRVAALMEEVGLSPDWMDRRIMHFSGGQRHRLALARALTLAPRIVVLDEALSGLDLSTQAQIANLLLDLQRAHSLTYLLISHDLALATRLADEVAVVSDGQIVETGTSKQILTQPVHAETAKLVASHKIKETKLASIMSTAQ